MSKKLKLTIKDEPEFHAIVQEWFKEAQSDRAFAIMGGTLVENCLELYLKSRLKDLNLTDGRTIFGELFDGKGSLDFNLKSALAFALGVLGQDDFNDLDIIRDVRNKFAHGIVSKRRGKSNVLVGLSFSSDEIKGRISKFSTNSIRESLIEQAEPPHTEISANRERFRNVAISLSLALWLSSQKAEEGSVTKRACEESCVRNVAWV
jgi:hypothetical protein